MKCSWFVKAYCVMLYCCCCYTDSSNRLNVTNLMRNLRSFLQLSATHFSRAVSRTGWRVFPPWTKHLFEVNLHWWCQCTPFLIVLNSGYWQWSSNNNDNNIQVPFIPAWGSGIITSMMSLSDRWKVWLNSPFSPVSSVNQSSVQHSHTPTHCPLAIIHSLCRQWLQAVGESNSYWSHHI